MAHTGKNSWVLDLYSGSGTPGGMGGFVYTRDSVYASSNPASECAPRISLICHRSCVGLATKITQTQAAITPLKGWSPSPHPLSGEIFHIEIF